MINENNLVNWLRFTRDIIDDTYITNKINTFIYNKNWHSNTKETSRLIYNKYYK